MKRDILPLMLGIPIKDFPVPPADQPGCLQDNCRCGERIWISAAKRNILKSNPVAVILCPDCMKKKFKGAKKIPLKMNIKDYKGL